MVAGVGSIAWRTSVRVVGSSPPNRSRRPKPAHQRSFSRGGPGHPGGDAELFERGDHLLHLVGHPLRIDGSFCHLQTCGFQEGNTVQRLGDGAEDPLVDAVAVRRGQCFKKKGKQSLHEDAAEHLDRRGLAGFRTDHA